MKKRRLSSKVGVFATQFCRVAVFLLLMLFLPGCVEEGMEAQTKNDHLTTNHSVRDIVSHPAFKGFGQLMLPWEDNTKYFDTRLNQVGSLMPYHGHVNADVVVGALNHLIDEALAGKTIFYDFYTERQKQELGRTQTSHSRPNLAGMADGTEAVARAHPRHDTNAAYA